MTNTYEEHRFCLLVLICFLVVSLSQVSANASQGKSKLEAKLTGERCPYDQNGLAVHEDTLRLWEREAPE